MRRDRDTLALVLGIVVFILGIALIVFSVYSFIRIATNPSSFFDQPGGNTPGGGGFGSGDLVPVAAIILMITMHITMAFVGSHLFRTGYHLLRPLGTALIVPMRPEARSE